MATNMDQDANTGDAPGHRRTFTFRVPRPVDKHTVHRLAMKYRRLRLTGLELSPEAFSSSFVAESQLADEVWMSRLTDPALETFICASIPSDLMADSAVGDMDVTDDALEWIAQVTVRGPISAADFALPPESGQSSIGLADEQVEEYWQILSLYMLPMYRGKGISKKLCQDAIAYLQKELGTPSAIQTLVLRTMIKPDNTTSIMLFKRLGFVEVGRCTLAEALTANGESLPHDAHDPKYHRRFGVILSLRLSRGGPSIVSPEN